MTKVAMIFEEEKQEALSQALSQAYTEMITKMIEKGYPTEEIISLVKGYSQTDIENLRKELN